MITHSIGITAALVLFTGCTSTTRPFHLDEIRAEYYPKYLASRTADIVSFATAIDFRELIAQTINWSELADTCLIERMNANNGYIDGVLLFHTKGSSVSPYWVMSFDSRSQCALTRSVESTRGVSILTAVDRLIGDIASKPESLSRPVESPESAVQIIRWSSDQRPISMVVDGRWLLGTKLMGDLNSIVLELSHLADKADKSVGGS